MNVQNMLDSIKKAICSGVDIQEKGIDRYAIHTEFTYPDGDELRIILKKQEREWILTDEGHTMMWLSYEDFNIKTDTRKDILYRSLTYNHAELWEGRIIVRFKPDKIAGAIHSMIQALLQTADLIYTDQENVRNTFVEDMQQIFCESVGKNNIEINKTIKNKRGEEYTVDVYVTPANGKEPLLVFAISNKDKCKDATIALMSLVAEDEMAFTSLAVIDSNAEIPLVDRDRMVSRSDKAYIGLKEMTVGLPRFLSKCNFAKT